NNLAYHVSTLLPSKAGDKQQIQRKRHIGNDIVCLVFVEGNQPFNPTAIKSQFLHVFIIVHKESWKDTHAWRVEIVYVEDVPPFGPPLPGKSAVFFDKKELESYLVAKLVNAEYAAFKSPKFALPMNRAREGIFTNLVEKGYHMLRTEETEPTEEVKEDTVKKHTKSPSTSSSISTIVSPTPSKSNAIREFSENIVSLGRRRSTQDLAEKPKNSNSKQLINKKSLAKNNKFAEGSKRSRSEQDLMNVTLDHTIVKQSFKNRAQNILTSFPGFGGHSQDDP
ncbi:Rap1 GTPase-activating protein 2, partial [Rhizopus stolonifer]